MLPGVTAWPTAITPAASNADKRQVTITVDKDGAAFDQIDTSNLAVTLTPAVGSVLTAESVTMDSEGEITAVFTVGDVKDNVF